MDSLAKSVYRTLVFFDAEDLSLTLLEIRAYLVAGKEPLPDVSLSALEQVLSRELSGQTHSAGGLYFLAGRRKLTELREARYRISLKRLRKCQKYLRFLRFVPYLRAVAISGSLALLNSEEDSDIDLFLITKKNRIWITRLLVSAYFQILGLRRYQMRIAGRFCLNHYVCEGALISQDRNLYTAVEYASLLPVLGHDRLKKFWQDNDWLKDFLHDPAPEIAETFFRFGFSRWQKVFETVLEYTIGPLLNRVSGHFQKKRIILQEHILVSDEELSFHPGSRGQKVLAKYREKLV